MVSISNSRDIILLNFALLHLQFTEIWCKIYVGVF